MLRSLKSLINYEIAAKDGAIGSVHDFYFDDRRWCVRYLVVDTGTWLPGRRVLLSPVSIGGADWAAKHIEVGLTKEQVENSPPLSADRPVSRQHERELTEYFAWPV